MDYWLDHLLTGIVVAMIGGGMIYSVSVIPFGPQTVWASSTKVTQDQKNKMTECLVVYDDISNGRVEDLDFGHARDCKKQIGRQKR